MRTEHPETKRSDSVSYVTHRFDRLHGIDWKRARDLVFDSDGKHSPNFDPDCPVQMIFYDFARGYPLVPSYHDYLEVTFVCAGEGLLHIGGDSTTIQSGDLVVIGDSELHRIEPRTSNLKVAAMYVMSELVYTPGANTVDAGYVRPFWDHSVDRHHVVKWPSPVCRKSLRLFTRIHLERSGQEPLYRLAIKNCVQELFLLLARFYKRFSIDTRGYTRRLSEVKRLANAFQYLEENFAARVALRDVADAVFMSPSHFCKFFKRVTGLTMTEYLTRIRVDRAKKSLIHGEETITEISSDVGFTSHSYFDRIFRRLNGVSPSQFREQNR